MAILFPQSDLYSRTITMRHLWITAQELRRETDRQEIVARRLFMELEGLGLQQVLHLHWNKPPWESFLPAAQPPTLYYPAPSQETRSPTPLPPPLTSPPPGALGNPIIIEDDDDKELDRLDNDFYTAKSMFSTPVSFLLHCQEYTSWQHQYFECPQYIHMWSLLPMSAGTPSVWLHKTLKPVTSTIVGDTVSNKTIWVLVTFTKIVLLC